MGYLASIINEARRPPSAVTTVAPLQVDGAMPTGETDDVAVAPTTATTQTPGVVRADQPVVTPDAPPGEASAVPTATPMPPASQAAVLQPSPAMALPDAQTQVPSLGQREVDVLPPSAVVSPAAVMARGVPAVAADPVQRSSRASVPVQASAGQNTTAPTQATAMRNSSDVVADLSVPPAAVVQPSVTIDDSAPERGSVVVRGVVEAPGQALGGAPVADGQSQQGQVAFNPSLLGEQGVASVMPVSASLAKDEGNASVSAPVQANAVMVQTPASAGEQGWATPSATPRAAAASSEPRVHIGRVDVVVMAPEPPRPTQQAVASSADLASRLYLRRL